MKPSEKINKTEKVKILNMVKEAMVDYNYDGYPWKTTIIENDKEEVEIDGQQVSNCHFSDEKALDEFYQKTNLTKSKLQSLSTEEQALLKEHRFFVHHLDLRKHSMTFVRCRNTEACLECDKHREENPLPDDFWDIIGIPDRDNGGFFFSPEPDTSNPGVVLIFICVTKLTLNIFRSLPDISSTFGPAKIRGVCCLSR